MTKQSPDHPYDSHLRADSFAKQFLCVLLARNGEPWSIESVSCPLIGVLPTHGRRAPAVPNNAPDLLTAYDRGDVVAVVRPLAGLLNHFVKLPRGSQRNRSTLPVLGMSILNSPISELNFFRLRPQTTSFRL